MPTKEQDPRPAQLENQVRQQFLDEIGQRVIQMLGRPDDLHRVQVRWLWGDCYRVNVHVGMDAVSTRISHSYFLTVDNQGNVLSSIPNISKRS